MDRQQAVDRILETENLTDNLEDKDANWLIDWGVAQVEPLIAGIEDDEEAGEKVNQLMAVMRHLNRLMPGRSDASNETLAQQVKNFFDAYAQAFGQSAPHTTDDHRQIAQAIRDKPTLEAIQHLVTAAKPKAAHRTTPAPDA